MVSLAPPSDPHSEALPVARPSGRLLAMAIISPAADVRYADPEKPHDPATQLGPQRWGFYGQYLLAYLDGGYIPAADRLGSPRSRPGRGGWWRRSCITRPPLSSTRKASSGRAKSGQGFDVLEFRRGTDGYSPVCRLLKYNPRDPLKPATAVADIDPATVTDTGRYIYCLQLP